MSRAHSECWKCKKCRTQKKKCEQVEVEGERKCKRCIDKHYRCGDWELSNRMTASGQTKKIKAERLPRASSDDGNSTFAGNFSSSSSTGSTSPFPQTPSIIDDVQDSTSNWHSPYTDVSTNGTEMEYKQETYMADDQVEGKNTQLKRQTTQRCLSSQFSDYIASMEPSSISFSSRILAHLHLRIQYIWGDVKSFDTRGMRLFGKKDFPSLTALTIASISEYFGIIAPQMALCYPIVQEAYRACGAADALRNKKLHPHVRREYEDAFLLHHHNTVVMINAAIDEEKNGGKADLWPLYHASFLYHASGACVGGPEYIETAKTAFEYFDKKVKRKFPFRIEALPVKIPGSNEENWTVCMKVWNLAGRCSFLGLQD